jgi:hypothetical protein
MKCFSEQASAGNPAKHGLHATGRQRSSHAALIFSHQTADKNKKRHFASGASVTMNTQIIG